MKTLLLSLCLMVSASAMAADCYKLETEVSVLRTLTAPAEVCVSNMNVVEGMLLATVEIDGEVLSTQTAIADDGKSLVYSKSTYRAGCEDLDAVGIIVNLDLNVDGTVAGINKVEGVAGYTVDICHTMPTSEVLVYSKVNN